jgi:hypothetical protein
VTGYDLDGQGRFPARAGSFFLPPPPDILGGGGGRGFARTLIYSFPGVKGHDVKLTTLLHQPRLTMSTAIFPLLYMPLNNEMRAQKQVIFTFNSLFLIKQSHSFNLRRNTFYLRHFVNSVLTAWVAGLCVLGLLPASTWMTRCSALQTTLRLNHLIKSTASKNMQLTNHTHY